MLSDFLQLLSVANLPRDPLPLRLFGGYLLLCCLFLCTSRLLLFPLDQGADFVFFAL